MHCPYQVIQVHFIAMTLIFRYVFSSAIYQAVKAHTTKVNVDIVCDKYFAGSIIDNPDKIAANSNNAFRKPSVIDWTFSGKNLANIERDKTWKIPEDIKSKITEI